MRCNAMQGEREIARLPPDERNPMLEKEHFLQCNDSIRLNTYTKLSSKGGMASTGMHRLCRRVVRTRRSVILSCVVRKVELDPSARAASKQNGGFAGLLSRCSDCLAHTVSVLSGPPPR